MDRPLKDVLHPLLTRTTLSVALLCAVLAAASGPFGTSETTSFWLRLGFWLAATISSTMIGNTAYRMIEVRLGADRPFQVDLAMILVMPILFTPLLWVLSRSFLLTEGRVGPDMGALASYIAMVTAVVCALRRVLPGTGAVGYFGADDTGDVADGVKPRLNRRLPDGFEGTILRLTVRDHFVDVITSTRTITLRMRFADAVDEMEPVPGHCTHRSHWVVTQAITGAQRVNGKLWLRLPNDDLVPVSRKYRPELEEAGLI